MSPHRDIHTLTSNGTSIILILTCDIYVTCSKAVILFFIMYIAFSYALQIHYTGIVSLCEKLHQRNIASRTPKMYKTGGLGTSNIFTNCNDRHFPMKRTMCV